MYRTVIRRMSLNYNCVNGSCYVSANYSRYSAIVLECMEATLHCAWKPNITNAQSHRHYDDVRC